MSPGGTGGPAAASFEKRPTAVSHTLLGPTGALNVEISEKCVGIGTAQTTRNDNYINDLTRRFGCTLLCADALSGDSNFFFFLNIL